MATVIGVRFKKAGKVYYFDPDGIWPRPGDYVIVETARGVEFGEVVTGSRSVNDAQIVTPLKKVIRVASEEDVQRAEANEKREAEAFRICQERIARHKLDMKLVSVEYTFDNNKIIFYFTANGRVDFRDLVKDLASVFKVRIDRRARRGKDAGWPWLLRQAHLLWRVPGGFPTRVHQDGQGAEPVPESHEDFRTVRAADVLPEVRAG